MPSRVNGSRAVVTDTSKLIGNGAEELKKLKAVITQGVKYGRADAEHLADEVLGTTLETNDSNQSNRLDPPSPPQLAVVG